MITPYLYYNRPNGRMGLMGLISRIGRAGDRLEEDGRPLGIGLVPLGIGRVAAWKRTGGHLELDG